MGFLGLLSSLGNDVTNIVTAPINAVQNIVSPITQGVGRSVQTLSTGLSTATNTLAGGAANLAGNVGSAIDWVSYVPIGLVLLGGLIAYKVLASPDTIESSGRAVSGVVRSLPQPAVVPI